MGDRIYSPGPTVRASVTPLYMQGLEARLLNGLGQDAIDTTMIDAGGDLIPPEFASVPIVPPITTPIDTAMIIAPTSLVPPTTVPAGGGLTPAEYTALLQASSNMLKTATMPGPSPRTPFLPSTQPKNVASVLSEPAGVGGMSVGMLLLFGLGLLALSRK